MASNKWGSRGSSSIALQSLVSFKKREEWQSWAQLETTFGEKEALLHIESGMISYREDPTTAGIWQYMDNQDIIKEKMVSKK